MLLDYQAFEKGDNKERVVTTGICEIVWFLPPLKYHTTGKCDSLKRNTIAVFFLFFLFTA